MSGPNHIVVQAGCFCPEGKRSMNVPRIRHVRLCTACKVTCLRGNGGKTHRKRKRQKCRGEPPTEYGENWEATSVLCEISMSKRILSEVTLRFGLDAPALFDKPAALTSIKPFPSPKPAFISTPSTLYLVVYVTKIPIGRNLFFLYLFIRRLSFQSSLDKNSRWSLFAVNLADADAVHLRIIYWMMN